MATDILQYDRMVENALRGVVREALCAGVTGLQGAHHFYITFRTNYPGVVLSKAMRARYPEEITIVLQHQYWDLEVADNWFEVTLSFNRISERLHVPFASIVTFADPSVEFGLQFRPVPASEGVGETPPERNAAEDAPLAPAGEEDGAKVIAFDAFRRK